MTQSEDLEANTDRCWHWVCKDEGEILLTLKGTFREDMYCEEHAEEMLERENRVKGRWWSQ